MRVNELGHPQESKLTYVREWPDARLVEHIELSRRRAMLWKRQFLTISYVEELVEHEDDLGIHLKSNPKLVVMQTGRCALAFDASVQVQALAPWCRYHVKRILARIKKHPEEFRQRTLLVGLMNFETLPRHPDEKRRKLRRFLPASFTFDGV